MPAPVTHPLASQQDPSSPITQSPPLASQQDPSSPITEELSDEDPPQEQANTDSSEDVGEVEELAVRYAYIQA